MVSIKDVAEVAGVSDRTVSRVVRGETELVKATTRKKVLKAIEKLQYVPNRAAQLMRTSRSMVIGLMTDVVATTPFSTDIVRGIQDGLEETPYTLLTINTSGDAAKERRSWQTFREHGIDGALYVTMYHRHLPENAYFPDIPVVLVNCKAPDRPDLPSIVPDDYQGAFDEATYLVAKGHRKIGYVTLNDNVLAARLRGNAFKDALAAHGIACREDWVTPGIEGEVFKDHFVAFERAKKILSSTDRPTAMMCGNDEIALQVMCAAFALGMQIPDDISIVGFDDFQVISKVTEPQLTTMALPYPEIGALAVNTLIKMMEGKQPTAPQHIAYKCGLVERASVGNLLHDA